MFARPKDLWTCPESKRRSPTHCHSDARAKRDRRNLLFRPIPPPWPLPATFTPFAFPHSPGVQRTRREGVPWPTPHDPFLITRG